MREKLEKLLFYTEKWCYFCYSYTKWEVILGRPSHCMRCHKTVTGEVITGGSSV